MALRDQVAALGAAGQWIAGLVLMLLLSWAALAVSVGVNAWQWRKAGAAKAECRVQMEQAASIAIEAEQKRATQAEAQARAIAADTRADTTRSAAQTQRNTYARETALAGVAVAGDCRMPAGGMPSIQPAIDEANAAAGD